MELRRLSHLLILADELHFARAAERANLSQSAFSRSIQAIEDEVGMRLFERSAADVRPTPSGEFVIARTRKLVLEARSLSRDIELYRNMELGDTAFGAGPSAAATLMPQVLTELRNAHPHVAIRVEVNNWRLLLARLHAEEIEFFVSEISEIPRQTELCVRPLPHQSISFFARAGHPLAAGACMFGDIARFGLASGTLPGATRAALIARLGLPSDAVTPFAVECDSLAVVRSLILSTDTVVLATNAMVRNENANGELVELSINDQPDLVARPGIVTLATRTPSPMAIRAMECTESVAMQY